jgi:RNA polymerase sigma-70 factor (ECF subfamily)
VDLQAVSDRPSPEDETISRNELRRVQAMIAALPARQGEAFSLFKIHGLSQREVALRMGLSESTVEKHLAKAVCALMAAMGHGGNAPEQASGQSARDRFAKRNRGNTEFTD